MDPREFIRQYISPFIKGEAADALVGTIMDELARGQALNVAVSDQLTICTAIGIYLDKKLANYGITRPSEIGISDDAFRTIGIEINATKLLTTTIHNILEVFYGPSAVRAYSQSSISAPYVFEDGMELKLSFEDGVERTLTFLESDFSDIGNAQANEVADAITRKLRDQGLSQALAVSFLDLETNEEFVRIFGVAKGPYSLVKILGGEIQNIMEFPEIRNTELPSNTTNWQITRNVGQTLRFRWDGGPAPLLDQVLVGDRVMIYGAGFENLGLQGTFEVTAVRPPKTVAAYDAGFFELINLDVTDLKSSQPNVAPPPNTISETYSYSVTQSSFQDLKFFNSKKNTSYSKGRFALGFEPANNLLRVYLPATTRVVERTLGQGGAYIHMLLPSTDFDGSFGSAVDDDAKIEIISNYVIRFRSEKLDNYGLGGTLTYGITEVPIDYSYRENDFTYIRTLEPHGLTGTNQWSMSTNYAIGDVVWRDGLTYTALQASGPGFGGARDPLVFQAYWQDSGAGSNLSTTVVDIDVDIVQADDENNPYPGAYMADLNAPFTLTNQIVTTREKILAGESRRTLTVLGTLPQSGGKLLFGLSKNSQETPVPYVTTQLQGAPTPTNIQTISQHDFNVVVITEDSHGVVPGDTVTIAGTSSMDGNFTVDRVTNLTTFTLTSGISQIDFDTAGTCLLDAPGTISTVVLDPTYQFENTHEIGQDVTLLSSDTAFVPAIDGSDYSLYVTSTADARQYCQDIIEDITALGIKLQIVVVYPDDVGLGNAGGSSDPADPPASEKIYVWGT